MKKQKALIHILGVVIGIFLFWAFTQSRFFVDVYHGSEIDNLKTADTLWLNHVKKVSPGIAIKNPVEIQNLLDSIKFARSDYGACGYQWKIFFFKEGKVFEKAYSVKHCHKNIVTSFGCFSFNREFSRSLNPYIKKLNKHDGTCFIYDFVFPVEVTPEEAFEKVKQCGCSPYLFEPKSDRYPHAIVKYKETGKSHGDWEGVEKVFEKKAEAEFQKLTDFLKQKDIYQHKNDFSGGSDLIRGEVVYKANMEIFFNIGVDAEEISIIVSSPLFVDEVIIPSEYSIQVMFPKELSERQKQDFIQSEPSIKGIKLSERH